MQVLSVKNLHKRFGGKEVLRGIDFSIEQGSIFGFVGLNGAGKTTVMKAILGLLRADEGEIYVCGERVLFGETKTNRHVGYLPDVPEFYSFLNAEEYLRLVGESLGMASEKINERSEELLCLVGLSGNKSRIKGYSRGMKQRLGIAQALLSSPKLLICDEPTSALDPVGRKEILDILSSLKGKTTVLFSTHVLSDVERICTDLALISNGKIAKQGSIDAVRPTLDRAEICVEVGKISDKDALLKRFDGARPHKRDSLIIPGGEERMLEIFDFITREKISVNKIERVEPTLEALFLEVTDK